MVAQILSESLKVVVLDSNLLGDATYQGVLHALIGVESVMAFAVMGSEFSNIDLEGLQSELEALVSLKNGRLQEISGTAIRTVNVPAHAGESVLDRHRIDLFYNKGINFIVGDYHMDFGSRIWGNRYIEKGVVKRFDRRLFEYVDHTPPTDRRHQ